MNFLIGITFSSGSNIYIDYGYLEINNCYFKGYSSDILRVFNSTLLLSNSSFIDNVEPIKIFYSIVTISDCYWTRLNNSVRANVRII